MAGLIVIGIGRKVEPWSPEGAYEVPGDCRDFTDVTTRITTDAAESI